MYTRVITVRGINDVEAAVDVLRQVVPTVQSQHGYRGMTASADLSAGVVGVLTLWETEADRDASEGVLAKTREAARERLGGAEMTVETFEERVVQLSRPPAPGCALMVTRARMDPARVDENVAFFEGEVAPQIAATPGFRALRNMINPRTGEALVGTVWDDEASMRAAAEGAMARRADAAARGVTFGDISYREIVFVDLG